MQKPTHTHNHDKEEEYATGVYYQPAISLRYFRKKDNE
jgi:hypothetical protein